MMSIHCNTLTVCCSLLQHNAACCSVVQYEKRHVMSIHCNTLTVCCSLLQQNAGCCSVVQYEKRHVLSIHCSILIFKLFFEKRPVIRIRHIDGFRMSLLHSLQRTFQMSILKRDQ